MNNFPEFNANQPALTQLSASKLNQVSLGQKSNQIQPGVGYRVTQTPGGTTTSVIKKRIPQTPYSWRLSIDYVAPDYKWAVSAELSTITEGGNGTKLDLSSGSALWIAASPIKFDVPTTIAATSWIVLECTVTATTYVLDDFTFKAVTTRATAQEVAFLGSPTFQQEKLRLLIGKIIFEDDVPRVVQGANTQMFIDWGMLNSRAVKCYLPPQLDPDLLA